MELVIHRPFRNKTDAAHWLSELGEHGTARRAATANRILALQL